MEKNFAKFNFITDKIKDIVSEYSGMEKEEIKEDLSLRSSIALNSFQLLSMISDIEDSFDIEISEYKIADFITLGDLENYVAEMV